MKKRYIWFGIIAAFHVINLLNDKVVESVIGLAVLSFVLYFTNSIESKYKKDGKLVGNEKLIVWVTAFLNPLVAQAFYYYCWKNQFPIRAGEANKIGWIVFVIMLVLGFVIGFSGVFKPTAM